MTANGARGFDERRFASTPVLGLAALIRAALGSSLPSLLCLDRSASASFPLHRTLAGGNTDPALPGAASPPVQESVKEIDR